MESSLSNEFAIEEKEHRPNVFLIDVQPSQKDGVLDILTEEGVKAWVVTDDPGQAKQN